MATRLATPQPPTCTLETSRAQFYQDVQNRNGVTRTEAEQVLAVLDQLIAVEPAAVGAHAAQPENRQEGQRRQVRPEPDRPRLLGGTPRPGLWCKAGRTASDYRRHGSGFGRSPAIASTRSTTGRGGRLTRTTSCRPIEFRYLRFPRDFDRVVKAMDGSTRHA